MRKIFCVFLLCCSITLNLASCYDAREIDEQAFVMSIGIEKGVSNKWRISFKFSVAKSNGKGSSEMNDSRSGNNNEYTSAVVDSPSFYAAINLVNSAIPERLNFTHAKYLLISEEVARTSEFSTIVASIVRFYQIRRSMNVIIVRGSVYDFLENANPVLGESLARFQEGLINEWKDSSFYKPIKLSDVNNSIKSSFREPIAILASVNTYKNFKPRGEKWEGDPKYANYLAGQMPRKGGGKVEFMGCAVGNGERVVDILKGFEARILFMARGEFKTGIFTIDDPIEKNKAVSIDMAQTEKPKVTVKFRKGKPIINIKISLKGDLMAIESRINYEDPEKAKVLERDIEKITKVQLDELIKKYQNLETDVFKFSEVAVRKFGTIQEWEDYNWNQKFKDAEVVTSVDFKIRGIGTLIKNSPIIKNGGEPE